MISWTPKNIVKLFVLVFVLRPWVWFFLGVNRYSRFKVPHNGPIILAVNHNSHLDTVLIFALLPLSVALRTSFVAAGDYFYDIPFLSWFLFDVFDMIPVWRDKKKSPDAPDTIDAMSAVLAKGGAVVLFPEGTRGLPEQRNSLKKGIARLAMRNPEVPIFPVHLRGLGKALPRGEIIFIPLIPQTNVDEPVHSQGKTEDQIMEELAERFSALDARTPKKDWVSA